MASINKAVLEKFEKEIRPDEKKPGLTNLNLEKLRKDVEKIPIGPSNVNDPEIAENIIDAVAVERMDDATRASLKNGIKLWKNKEITGIAPTPGSDEAEDLELTKKIVGLLREKVVIQDKTSQSIDELKTKKEQEIKVSEGLKNIGEKFSDYPIANQIFIVGVAYLGYRLINWFRKTKVGRPIVGALAIPAGIGIVAEGANWLQASYNKKEYRPFNWIPGGLTPDSVETSGVKQLQTALLDEKNPDKHIEKACAEFNIPGDLFTKLAKVKIEKCHTAVQKADLIGSGHRGKIIPEDLGIMEIPDEYKGRETQFQKDLYEAVTVLFGHQGYKSLIQEKKYDQGSTYGNVLVQEFIESMTVA
jgi:hypothetical protein